jgi:hypothetical protein
MTPYAIHGPGRQCCVTGRTLRPGEAFYSALADEDGQFIRKDYAADAWPGPPPGCIGYWKGRVPAGAEKRRLTINEELLLDCLGHLSEATEPSRLNFRYVVALLLMRRRRLRFEDARKEGDLEVLHLRDTRSGTIYRVMDPRLGESEMAAVQDEVFKVLGWD